jgi:hypothetical protein
MKKTFWYRSCVFILDFYFGSQHEKNFLVSIMCFSFWIFNLVFIMKKNFLASIMKKLFGGQHEKKLFGI